MASFDGAEVCELVGFYLLDILRREFGDGKIDMYRDDRLRCFQNYSDPESEKMKKNLCKSSYNMEDLQSRLQLTDYRNLRCHL